VPPWTPTEEDEGMTTLVERLRQRSFRLTPQRRVIADVLAGTHVHLTADDVFERARAELPEVSLATVYNTLNEMVAIGELRELSVDGRTRRYDPNLGDHHHLVCEGCAAVLDVHLDGPVPPLPASEAHGFELVDVAVLYRGRCPACRSAAG
jgi:Fur family transcriptional regulator, stress-responsive regulator